MYFGHQNFMVMRKLAVNQSKCVLKSSKIGAIWDWLLASADICYPLSAVGILAKFHISAALL